MKEFTKMIIIGDIVNVYCSDDGKEDILFSLDLSNHYWIEGKDLKHNVFSSELDWLLDDEDVESDELEEIRENINDEFMENFCCDVPSEINYQLENQKVNINVPKEFEDSEEYLSDVFQEAIKAALGLDEKWNKIK